MTRLVSSLPISTIFEAIDSTVESLKNLDGSIPEEGLDTLKWAEQWAINIHCLELCVKRLKNRSTIIYEYVGDDHTFNC